MVIVSMEYVDVPWQYRAVRYYDMVPGTASLSPIRARDDVRRVACSCGGGDGGAGRDLCRCARLNSRFTDLSKRPNATGYC